MLALGQFKMSLLRSLVYDYLFFYKDTAPTELKKMPGAVVAVFATTISLGVVANTATTAPVLFMCFMVIFSKPAKNTIDEPAIRGYHPRLPGIRVVAD